MGENARLSYTVPEIGMTIRMCVAIGNIVMFASTVTTTPNSAFYDYSLNITAIENSSIDCGEVYVISEANRRRRDVTTTTGNITLHMAVSGLQKKNEFAIKSTTGDTRSGELIIEMQALWGEP